MPVVMAAVLTAGHKAIAVRTWELVEDGVLVTCQCEKFPCPANDRSLSQKMQPTLRRRSSTILTGCATSIACLPSRVTFFSHIRDTLRPMRY